MLELHDVTYAYPGAGQPALAGLSLSIAPSERVVLRGANGSGKSTAASLLNGALLPDAGSVVLDGIALTSDTAATFAQLVGVVRQDPLAQLVEPTVFEEVAFGPQCLGLPAEEVRARAQDALATCGLTGFEHKGVFELSGGQQQLCALAGVLAMRPRYLVLDEAGAHLDRAGAEALRRAIDATLAAGVGVLQISHDPRDVAGADHAYELRRSAGVSTLVPYGQVRTAQDCIAGLPSREGGSPTGDNQPVEAPQSADTAPVLTAEHISFAYDDNGVLEDVSLAVHEGELALICGPCGAGKSTFGRILAGVLQPGGGAVRIGGAPVRPGSVGLVMQRAEDQLFAARVRDDVAYGPRNLGLTEAEVEARVERALGMMGVPHEAWDASPFTFSGGMRRRVALAGVVALRPAAYVFDEPDAGLDDEARALLHELVTQLLAEGTAVVIVTHKPRAWAQHAAQTLTLTASRVAGADGSEAAPRRAPASNSSSAPDSRASLAAALLLTVALFAAHDARGLAIAGAAAAALALWSHVRPRDLTTMLKPAAVLAALMFVSQTLVLDGSFDLQLMGPFGVRVASVVRAACSALRILGLVVLAGVAAKAVATTSPTTLASAAVAPLRALSLRTDAATMAIAVTLRMMPEVTREFGRITTAQRARAGHLDEGRSLQRLKSYASVLVPLIVSLMQRSDDLARAMHDRCYTGSLTRLDEPLKVRDMLLIASAVAVLIAVCVV